MYSYFRFLAIFIITFGHGVRTEEDNYSVYEGYKLIEVTPQNTLQSSILGYFQKQQHKIPSVNFLSSTKLPNVPNLLLVPPESEIELQTVLRSSKIPFKIVNNDLVTSIRAERSENSRRRSPTGIDFESYRRFDEISGYLEDLSKKYPQQAKLIPVGKSFEGRQMNALRITDSSEGRSDKKVIFIDAGIHAREWIAPATALFVIHQLVENFDSNRDLLKDYDWVILPVVNPDGYEYSHTKERFWRKTRKPNSFACVGTDANRNFDFHWGETGASNYACAETYRGPKAFSEPETEALKKVLESFEGNCKMYLSLHSYGNYLLYPWGYESTLPPTWQDLDEISMAGANAIKNATGTEYTVGSSTNVLYAAAGASDDYAFGPLKIPVSITMELSGAGSGGFDPPASKIKPFVEEAWIGIKAMAEAVSKKY
ncbi:carboxypeptidase B-like [Episyrphus balteatus]|uniref:carboxypeptidase B-like n=1 Tax=Episyrphus balteatus TaxID=286459 RepID=UPI0024852178|nr:carboxypeptidase B-like [Episyrphus balteatus]